MEKVGGYQDMSETPSNLLEATYRAYRINPTDELLVRLLKHATEYRSSLAPSLGLVELRAVGPTETCQSVMEKAALKRAAQSKGTPEDFGWKRVENNYSDFCQIRVRVGRRLSVEDMSRVAGCLGYALRAELAGEDLSEPLEVVYDSEEVEVSHPGSRLVEKRTQWSTTLIFSYDSTKSRRDDPDFLGAFIRAVEYIHNGTPIRKTDRAGVGTKGTSLVKGIGPCEVTFWVQ